jgi:hypothetical protein
MLVINNRSTQVKGTEHDPCLSMGRVVSSVCHLKNKRATVVLQTYNPSYSGDGHRRFLSWKLAGQSYYMNKIQNKGLGA